MTKSTTHIALVCPGGPITHDLAEKIVEITANHCRDAVQLTFHPQCFETDGHFAGSDATRSAAFLEVANDPQVDAIWFARGGYGAIRLHDDVFDRMNAAARSKTYFGYSDNGVILARLFAKEIGHVVHGPIPVDINRDRGHDAICRALDYMVFGKPDGLEPSAMKSASAAFNITVLAHLIGLDWAPGFSGMTLMLEDVGEYLYRVDRALAAILLSPKMENAVGIRLGRIGDVPENDRPFGANAEEIARYWCERAGIPYLGQADIGHDAANKIVPFRKPAFAA